MTSQWRHRNKTHSSYLELNSYKMYFRILSLKINRMTAFCNLFMERPLYTQQWIKFRFRKCYTLFLECFNILKTGACNDIQSAEKSRYRNLQRFPQGNFWEPCTATVQLWKVSLVNYSSVRLNYVTLAEAGIVFNVCVSQQTKKWFWDGPPHKCLWVCWM